jgi:hypothetical protein
MQSISRHATRHSDRFESTDGLDVDLCDLMSSLSNPAVLTIIVINARLKHDENRPAAMKTLKRFAVYGATRSAVSFFTDVEIEISAVYSITQQPMLITFGLSHCYVLQAM